MKLLKTQKNSLTKIEPLMSEADRIAAEEKIAFLINCIREGDETKIPELVKCSEYIVTSIIIKSSIYMPKEEMMACANTALTKLAQLEINNNGKQYYQSFCAFVVKQSLYIKQSELSDFDFVLKLR